MIFLEKNVRIFMPIGINKDCKIASCQVLLPYEFAPNIRKALSIFTVV